MSCPFVFSFRPHLSIVYQVTALREIFRLGTRDDAVSLGVRLQRLGYLHHAYRDDDDDRSAFGDNSSCYLLHAFRRPHVLNSFRTWDGKLIRIDGPIYIVQRLTRLWTVLESRHLDECGRVDHGVDFRNDDMLWRFEEDVCELQDVRLTDMNEETRLAFVINLYNVMIKYAFFKVGMPVSNPLLVPDGEKFDGTRVAWCIRVSLRVVVVLKRIPDTPSSRLAPRPIVMEKLTSSDRASFYGDVSVDVGGEILSFDDLEHGILRGNNRHPYQLSRRFTTPARQRLALRTLDPRVHFALNCGASSCPPIKWYTPDGIDEELRLAAMAFCEQDDNVRIDEENRTVHLTKLMHWYQSDFGELWTWVPPRPRDKFDRICENIATQRTRCCDFVFVTAPSKDELPRAVGAFLSKEKKSRLDRLIKDGNFNVKFIDYDWSTHGNVNTTRYEKGDLSNKSYLPFTRNPPAPIYHYNGMSSSKK